MNNLMILFSVFIFFSSCEKNHHVIHVSATNIVTGSGSQYEGLKFSVVATTSGVFESNYKNVYEGYLDQNGQASFDLKMKNNKSYKLGIELPENSCYFNDLYFSLKHDLKTQTVNIVFAPCAFLKLDITNINCMGINDSMRFRSKLSFEDWEIWSSYRVGCYDYVSADYFEIPSGWRIYEWEVNRSGVITTFIDSIYLESGEYKTFEINY